MIAVLSIPLKYMCHTEHFTQENALSTHTLHQELQHVPEEVCMHVALNTFQSENYIAIGRSHFTFECSLHIHTVNSPTPNKAVPNDILQN